jgi:hypothetical protein
VPYVVLVGSPGEPYPLFAVPRWTRRGAEREAASARELHGVGCVPAVGFPVAYRVHEGHLWAEVVFVPWRTWIRTRGRPRDRDVGWGPA